jgi:hypothetical protein
MEFVMLLRANPARVSLQKHAAIALFACAGTHSGGTCESWEAKGGGNAVFLLDNEALEKKPLAAPPSGAKGPPAVAKARALAYKERFEPDPAVENVEDARLENKVGGYPVWVQSPEEVVCAKCNKPMRFVAQISDALDRALNFGGGFGYLFVCPDEHTGGFVWQQ